MDQIKQALKSAKVMRREARLALGMRVWRAGSADASGTQVNQFMGHALSRHPA
jgi:hypothetical protein